MAAREQRSQERHAYRAAELPRQVEEAPAFDAQPSTDGARTFIATEAGSVPVTSDRQAINCSEACRRVIESGAIAFLAS
jgi:hypothetical protein